MYEDLAHSATAAFLFVLAGFSLSWLLSPITTSWELARLKISPRSMDERLSGQSLVGPVIVLGAIGFIISGIVGWSVGMLMQDFDPVHFTKSSRHINITLVSLAIFAVTAYLTNAYARFGSGKPANLGERLYELQHQERGIYSPEHMDERHWLLLRENTTTPWDHLRTVDRELLTRLVGSPLPPEPWNHVKQEIVLSWRSAHPEERDPQADRALARALWKHHPAHWVRLGILAVFAAGLLVLAADSHDVTAMVIAALAVLTGLGVVPPLLLRATRAANRRRTAVLARDLLWTKRTVYLIDQQLATLRIPGKPESEPSWAQLLSDLEQKVRARQLE